MKNGLIILITLVVLTIGNWAAAAILQMDFLDIAIPFAGLAVVLIYFFKSKGGMASRQLDMSIQGQTGIRMEREAHTAERSYIFIGSILYLLIVFGLTFYIYRQYFLT